MLYPILRRLLFLLETETAHNLTLNALDLLKPVLAACYARRVASLPTTVMGLTFPNPVGLAAGLDRHAEHVRGLAALGFGFIEVGTVVPKPQQGNPKPRLFRLPKANALINRMGFYSKGIDAFVEQLSQLNYDGILGINIGKNRDTAIEDAAEDYLICLRAVYPYASYITINISSPNTPGLRDLQKQENLYVLLNKLKNAQLKLQTQYGKYVPLVVKVDPDQEWLAIQYLAQVLLDCEIDGVIATNTSVSRDGVTNLTHSDEQGGLSGQPIFQRSTTVLKQLSQCLQGRIPIIGLGGILNAAYAHEKFYTGARLVQIYTGLIYRGPAIIREIVNSLI